ITGDHVVSAELGHTAVTSSPLAAHANLSIVLDVVKCTGGQIPVEEEGVNAAMRFRCKIVDVSCLNHFTRVVNTITKLTKSCTLRLTPDNLYFILTDKVANGGVSMWCELCQVIRKQNIFT
ncbi:hypothetical protein AB205_0095090, partial [Aquarana catesbeiana]